jgi:ketosteroid isomerase-like protein
MRTPSTWLVIAAMTLSGILLQGLTGDSVAASGFYGSGSGDDALEKQIVAKEREGLDALKAGDVEQFGKLTADEAVLVDAHGPASKAQVLKNVAGFTLTDYSMEDMRFLPIDAYTGLISYKISEKGNSHGKEFTAQAYVSSVWTERGKQWLCLFSQETAAH